MATEITYPITLIERTFVFDSTKHDPYEAYNNVGDFVLEKRNTITNLDVDSRMHQYDHYSTSVEFSYKYDIKDEEFAIEFEKKYLSFCSVTKYHIIENFYYEIPVIEVEEETIPLSVPGSALEALRARVKSIETNLY